MRSLLEFVTFLTFVCTSDVCHTNKCITFSVGSGTGCDWMCNYCATNLGTNNYYFTEHKSIKFNIFLLIYINE